jgi:hypothetical protein
MEPPSTNPLARSTTRNLARAALGGIACFTLAFVALHILQPDLSLLDEAMSYYVHGEMGWLTTVGLLGLGLGSLSLTIALARLLHGRGWYVGVACLAVWSISVLVGGVFPADPPGNWDKPPSLAGAVHGYAAVAGLFVFPFAAVLLSRVLRREKHGRGAGGITMLLAVASAASLVACIASLTPAIVTSGPPLLLGLTERIMLAAYAAWLTAVAMSLLIATYSPSGDKAA